MKQKLALLCAAALLLSACAQSAGQPGADVSGAESGASAPADGVYENCRILTMQQAQDAPYLSDQIEMIQSMREQYSAAEVRYMNLAGTVSEESLGETLGTLRLSDAVYDSSGENVLPSGAVCTIEWNIPDDLTHVTVQDGSGGTVLEVEQQADGTTQVVAISVNLTNEECGSLAFTARMLVQNRYAASGSRAPFSVQATPAQVPGDQMSDDEVLEMIRSVSASVSRLWEWERDSGYVLMDLTSLEQGIVMECRYNNDTDPSYSLYLPSLSFDTAQAYQDTRDDVLLRTTPEADYYPPFCTWDGKLWVTVNQPGIGGSYGIRPEKIDIVSKEPERIVADIWQTYNDSGVSAIPLYSTRYEFTVQDGNWVADSLYGTMDEESYNVAVNAWDAWFNEHYAQFYFADGGTEADLGTLWESLGAGQGSWSGTEEGEWNENAILVSPGFAFSVQDGKYAVSLYSTLGSGATTFFANSALTDGQGNYIVTFGSFAGEVMEEETYSENSRPQLWIETGAEGDGLIEIAGQRISQLDGWMYEYQFTASS